MSKELTYRIDGLGDVHTKMRAVWEMVNKALQGGAVEVALRRPSDKRSLDQNARLWAVLTDVSKQVEWHGRYLPKEAWKDIFSAALERQDVVPGLEGGFVMIGGRTSKMTKQRFADLLTLIDAFGADHDVVWSDPALRVLDEYREAREAA
ncbi:recombination protein NinB [Halomonas sp. I1]|uniref:recombination protein NinB n=1 Tax=Halomonas sp. I1 TaxID=393536 RepID=UPI0028DEAD5C|nr:recombination protein NinB [Halomonas sp. I1]MDT8894205.1 recombination protein NinB [Halomonas sp. I1]